MEDQRRLLFAVALSLLVLTAYSLLFPSKPRVPQVTPSAVPAPGEGPITAASPLPPAGAPLAEAPAAPQVPQVADSQERRVEVVDADRLLAFTNRGARLLSWQLVAFKDPKGRPEEMVQAAPGGARPLDVETGDPALDARLREALYRPSTETLEVPATGPATLRFEYSDSEVAAEKTLTFDRGSTLVSLTVAVKRRGQDLPVKILWGPGIGNPTAAEMEVQGYTPPQAVALVGPSVARASAEKLTQAQELGRARWAGMESHYFAALLVAPGTSALAEVRPVKLPALKDGEPRPAALVALDHPAGAGPVAVYVGAKDYDVLEKAGHGLSHVVLAQIGDWIGPPIVVPFMRVVRKVHDRVGNWGWAIVAVTVIINLIMAPLRHYSIANGLKMARISPEMKVIQERYRKVPLLDPKRQQMQEEMAVLYGKHGLNMSTQMMVGCLPILLTMPFLIAFYRVLSVAVDLRGAPFLWISDLSQKDPLFLTPVLMGVSMFAMQKMTPTAMDPAQQRIMMLMPLMLAGMLLWAPAGLNLYWLASNVCAIAQQAITYAILNRKDGAAVARGRG